MKTTLLHGDCIELMQHIPDGSVDMVLTDIPYGVVNRDGNGLRNINKGNADTLTFSLDVFLPEIYRAAKNSICVFCGKEQFSEIYEFFSRKPGTVRAIVWQKTNPSPMNGQYVYLSGVELAVWFKKAGGHHFTQHCKNTVFRYPSEKSKIHPTQKKLISYPRIGVRQHPKWGLGFRHMYGERHNRRCLRQHRPGIYRHGVRPRIFRGCKASY